MKAGSIVAAAVLLGLGACTSARVKYETKNQYSPPRNGPVCVLETGLPESILYESVATIQVSIKHNASQARVAPVMAQKARQLGADAIIKLETELVFRSPLPWAVVGPRGQGLAVRLLPNSPPLDCIAIGGTNL